MIYLDYAANTPVSDEVLETFVDATKKYTANPNSSHKAGLLAREQIDSSSTHIAKYFNCPKESVIYTSGSSESNNLVIKGIAERYKDKGKHIIISPLEHSSIVAPCNYLSSHGYEVSILPLTKEGKIDLEVLKETITDKTILVSICAVDSELGTIQPINEVGDIVSKYPNCIFHTDATQAIGKTNIDFTGVDFTGVNIAELEGKFDLLINATPDATLRLLMDANTNDYITLNGDATIRATYHNKGAFNMFGTFTVDHGTYGVTIQNIIKKNFIFNRGGTIIFAGDPYQAALNLQAVHTVSGVSLSDLNIGNSFSSNTIRVNCLMNIGGITAAPQVDFDLEMPTVNADEQQMIRSIINGQQEMNQQVIYLLGIGRFYTQGVNNAGNTAQGDQTSLAMQSLFSGALSAQINNILNQFLKNDNWNFGANITTGNEGWHNAEYEGIINGRMLNNRLLLNGQFGYRDNAKQATPSFIGDFDVQYLLYPNGNLALKVYNQTNDRYFTKSSLNTQGLGIIMKKDFNGLRDLFTSKKRKKKSPKQDK